MPSYIAQFTEPKEICYIIDPMLRRMGHDPEKKNIVVNDGGGTDLQFDVQAEQFGAEVAIHYKLPEMVDMVPVVLRLEPYGADPRTVRKQYRSRTPAFAAYKITADVVNLSGDCVREVIDALGGTFQEAA